MSDFTSYAQVLLYTYLKKIMIVDHVVEYIIILLLRIKFNQFVNYNRLGQVFLYTYLKKIMIVDRVVEYIIIMY